MNNLNILFEDKHILVCEKPAGIPVQTKSFGTKDMESMLKNHLAGSSAGKPPYLAIIHRLDQPVSGILVFGKTKEAAAKLNAQMQKDGFSKYYQAVLCGTLSPANGTLVDYLVKDGRTNTSRIGKKGEKDAKLSELSYETLSVSADEKLSIVKIKLKTGLHHQIRVQMSGAGAPLWGDNKYNPEYVNKRGYYPIALCAYRLELSHPVTGKPLSFELKCNWPQFEQEA